jgi:hypothetical protein
MNMSIKNRLSKEALAFMIEDIGDEILDCFSTEEFLNGLSVEERVAGLTTEEIISALTPERISGLNPEQRRQLQQLLEQ